MGVDLRPALSSDVLELHRSLRAADRREVMASSGPDVLTALRTAVAITPDCFAAESGHVLLALAGTVPTSRGGAIWLLGTEELYRHSKSLTAMAFDYVDRRLRDYPCLFNYVHARNTAAMRWLRRLGFELYAPERIGYANDWFHLFWKGERPCVTRPSR